MNNKNIERKNKTKQAERKNKKKKITKSPMGFHFNITLAK